LRELLSHKNEVKAPRRQLGLIIQCKNAPGPGPRTGACVKKRRVGVGGQMKNVSFFDVKKRVVFNTRCALDVTSGIDIIIGKNVVLLPSLFYICHVVIFFKSMVKINSKELVDKFQSELFLMILVLMFTKSIQ
jgi:hypothetical protein